MIRKNKKPVVVQRREVGLYIGGDGKYGIYGCFVIYEEAMSDGSIRKTRGHTLRTTPSGADFGGSKSEKEYAQLTLAPPDMVPLMQAGHVIQSTLMSRCMASDAKLGFPTGFFMDGKEPKPG